MKEVRSNLFITFSDYYFTSRFDRFYSQSPRNYFEYLGRSIGNAFYSCFYLLRDMSKDYFFTFKPYEAHYYRIQNYIQPAAGFVNLLRALLSFAFIPCMFVIDFFSTIACLLFSQMGYENERTIGPRLALFLPALILTALTAVARALEAAVVLTRALTQLITTPLTWLLKIPFRNLLTSIMGSPKVEENEEMQKILFKLQDNEICDMNVYEEVHDNFRLLRERGQETAIVNENSLYTQLNSVHHRPRADLSERDAKLNYHRLFLPALNLPPPLYVAPVNAQMADGPANIGQRVG